MSLSRYIATRFWCAPVLALFAAVLLHGQVCSAQSSSRSMPTPPRRSQPKFRDQGPQYAAVGDQPLVMGVRVTGAETIKQSALRNQISTRKNRRFDPERVQDDVRSLMSLDSVSDVQTKVDPAPGGVVVTFLVVETPRTRYVRFIGNRGLSDRALLRQSGLKVDEAADLYSVREARRKVEEFYRTRGYPKAGVSILEGDKPSDRGVALLINEGKLQRIWSVQFIGNDPKLISGARLKTKIKSKPGYGKFFFRGKVDRKKIAEDTDRIVAFYRDLGYFQARVSPDMEVDDSGKWITLKFIIDEGPRSVIRNISIAGNTRFSEEDLLSRIKLKTGEYYNLGAVRSDESMLSDLYGGNGYVEARVVSDTRLLLEEQGKLDLIYKISEGDRFSVGEIRVLIKGDNPHTMQSVILNRLSFAPGDIIDIRKIRDSELRLRRSSLFEVDRAVAAPPEIVIRPPDPAVQTASRPAPAAAGSPYRGQNPSPRGNPFKQPSPRTGGQAAGASLFQRADGGPYPDNLRPVSGAANQGQAPGHRDRESAYQLRGPSSNR